MQSQMVGYKMSRNFGYGKISSRLKHTPELFIEGEISFSLRTAQVIERLSYGEVVKKVGMLGLDKQPASSL